MNSTGEKLISGSIEGVTLFSFLQMLEMEQKTCIVNVSSKAETGRIFFLNGTLIDALTAGQQGVEALYTILSWQDLMMEVTANTSPRPNRINLPLMHIVMESARRLDETAECASENKARVHGRKIQLTTRTSNSFCLETGINLIIEPLEGQTHFKSSLVGIEPEQFLILKVPRRVDSFIKTMTQCEKMVVKTLYKGTIYAFRSSLISMIEVPSRLLFIEYPNSIELHELRSHKRFKCNIAAQAKVNEQERCSVIENISKGGCLCTVQTLASDKNLPATLLKNTLVLKCRFPGLGRELQVQGEIKNARQTSGEVTMGLEFKYTEDAKGFLDAINEFIQVMEYSGKDV